MKQSRPQGNPKFVALLEEILALHNAKNHDYSDRADPLSNFRMALHVGVAPLDGVLVRMSDKWSRIGQLRRGKTPKNESLRDSLIDLSVYALLGILLLEEEATGNSSSRAGARVSVAGGLPSGQSAGRNDAHGRRGRRSMRASTSHAWNGQRRGA